MFILAAGDTYNADETGGETEHTLLKAELPQIEGSVAFNSNGNTQGVIAEADGDCVLWERSSGEFKPNSYQSGAGYRRFKIRFGGDQPHNNMPPYLVRYYWERTA